MKKRADLSSDNIFNVEGKEFSIGSFLEKLSDLQLILLCDQLHRTMKLRKVEIPLHLKPFKAKIKLKTKKFPENKGIKIKKLKLKKTNRKRYEKWKKNHLIWTI